MSDAPHFETLAIRTQAPTTPEREHSVPLFLTSSFRFDDAEHARALFTEEVSGNIYSRYSNPNTDEFVRKLCLLEGGANGNAEGIATATGMSAVFTALAARVSAGDHIIGIWGGARRIYAAMKFFLFTMAGSLLMFLAILWLAARHQAVTGDWSFALEDLAGLPIAFGTQTILFLAFALAFAIKVPVFPLHTWLPDAHTEAPTAGSIILAGVLLKLGVYGYLRFGLTLFPEPAMRYAPWLGVLGVIGIVYGAMVAFAQKDMKKLVAYSSVSHLGLVVMGIGAFTSTALSGAVLQMVNHGLSTGALFLLVGVLYERRHTREMAAYGGVAGLVPVTTAFFLVATFSSIGLPGLNGFVGEFLTFLGTWDSPYRWWSVVAVSGIILSAVYMLTLVQRVFWNPLVHEENKSLTDMRPTELIPAAVLVVLMVWIGVRPNDFLSKINPTLEALRRTTIERTLAAEAQQPEPVAAAGTTP